MGWPKGYAKVALVGARFGRLTVTRVLPGGHRICQCECGVERGFRVGNLRAKHTQSCGCLKVEVARSKAVLINESRGVRIGNPIGRKFGDFIVVEPHTGLDFACRCFRCGRHHLFEHNRLLGQPSCRGCLTLTQRHFPRPGERLGAWKIEAWLTTGRNRMRIRARCRCGTVRVGPACGFLPRQPTGKRSWYGCCAKCANGIRGALRYGYPFNDAFRFFTGGGTLDARRARQKRVRETKAERDILRKVAVRLGITYKWLRTRIREGRFDISNIERAARGPGADSREALAPGG